MTSPEDELAALRERAYGPGADIHDDPDALARLYALEAEAKPVVADAQPVVADVQSDVADAQPGAAVTASAPADAPAEPAEPKTAPPHAARPIPRGWLIAWAASIALVGVITGAIVFSVASIRPVSPVTGAVQVATLDEPTTDESIDWLPQWFGSRSRAIAFEYLGLVAVRVPQGFYDDDQPCLMVGDITNFTRDGDSISYEGRTYTGCGAGPFPATVQFVVDDQSPAELRAHYPDGTALSFVLDGDVVGVFMAAPSSPTPRPA